jgi:hypothetical protein
VHSTPFLWVPGQGCDPVALRRLEQTFARPKQAMGEAWFMSDERKMYRELLGELGALPVERLQYALTEIATGTCSFGKRDEWRDWFHYLLPRLIPRCHERFVDPLLEILITAFFTQHPASIDDEPYPGFREDVLNTLGRCLMDGIVWSEGPQGLECRLYDREYMGRRWSSAEASGALSASMFLCLKYLEPGAVEAWIGSALMIEEAHWRAQLMCWLSGEYGVLTGKVRQPSAFDERAYPRIGWDWSHILDGDQSPNRDGSTEKVDFIPEPKRQVALDKVRAHFTEAVCLDWLASFAADSELEAAMAAVPYAFFDQYGVGQVE